MVVMEEGVGRPLRDGVRDSFTDYYADDPE